MNEKNTTKQMNSSAGPSEATRKPKRPRVSQRKELAVVTVGMVAAIASLGGLLAGNQAQANPPADTTTPAAQESSPTPGSQQPSEVQPSEVQPSEVQPPEVQTPAYSPATDSASGNTSHAQSQGS